MNRIIIFFLILFLAIVLSCNRYLRDANWIQTEYKKWSESLISNNPEYDDYNLTKLLQIKEICTEMQSFKAPDGYPAITECDNVKKSIDTIRDRNSSLEKKKYFESLSLLLIPANMNIRLTNNAPNNPYASFSSDGYNPEPFQINVPRGMGIDTSGDLFFMPLIFNLGEQYYIQGQMTVKMIVTSKNNNVYTFEDIIIFTARPHSRGLITSPLRKWKNTDGIAEVSYFIQDIKIIN